VTGLNAIHNGTANNIGYTSAQAATGNGNADDSESSGQPSSSSSFPPFLGRVKPPAFHHPGLR
jgi:hypothetical protein